MKSNFSIGFLLFAFALIISSGCGSWIKAYSEEEPGVNLAQYYTYNWLANNTTPDTEPAQYPLSRHAEDKIRSATDAQMQRFGYQHLATSPDLLLHYHVVVEKQVSLQHDLNCSYSDPGQNGYCKSLHPVYFREGTLIIDFMDTRTGQQVWRGIAVEPVENYSSGQWDAEIEDAIRQIFKKFPIKPRPQNDLPVLARE